ncbi:uncharacterized protein LOC128194829 isoform X3 [Vigna angularis]|uniref:uncharacterized protein LOC128194829 isoform X3 n=1 Tax=Phaseolus angularis TaxID=3914 RepID=UPI0022B34C7B|nr:uncharacterized protein LOC128194829 isoform X3 [Vigna angularis]
MMQKQIHDFIIYKKGVKKKIIKTASVCTSLGVLLAVLQDLETILLKNSQVVSSLTSSNVKLESQVSSLTSQVNEMKAIMTLLLQNHQGPLPSQFAVFQRSSVSDQGSGSNNGCNKEKN